MYPPESALARNVVITLTLTLSIVVSALLIRILSARGFTTSMSECKAPSLGQSVKQATARFTRLRSSDFTAPDSESTVVLPLWPTPTDNRRMSRLTSSLPQPPLSTLCTI